MKATGIVPRFLSIFVVFVYVLFAYEAFGNIVVSYGWDGLLEGDPLEGWTKELPFEGDLDVSTTFGYPGGSMFATDTKSSSSGLLARAPDVLSGDLTAYTGIYWDEYIPGRSNTKVATFIILEGSDGTMYESERIEGSAVAKNFWNQRFEPLNDPSAWFLVKHSGSASFDDVIADVAGLLISMDTSSQSQGRVESWVDNFEVHAVPVPGAVWLLGSGLVTLAAFKRKFRKN